VKIDVRGIAERPLNATKTQRMLSAMKSDRYLRSIIFIVSLAISMTVCSRIASAGQQSSLNIEGLNVLCNRGTYLACFSLGTAYASGNGVTKDDSRAVALFQRACDGGNAQGCSGLGFMYETEAGVGKDVALALTLYRKACDGGGVWAAPSSRECMKQVRE
jgi:TPR repeat protein